VATLGTQRHMTKTKTHDEDKQSTKTQQRQLKRWAIQTLPETAVYKIYKNDTLFQNCVLTE